MASCERCWELSGGNPDRYRELLRVNKCTPEQQAGQDAGVCSICHRKTLHQYVPDVCMNPDCPKGKPSVKSSEED